jgi:hypothetical protein
MCLRANATLSYYITEFIHSRAIRPKEMWKLALIVTYSKSQHKNPRQKLKQMTLSLLKTTVGSKDWVYTNTLTLSEMGGKGYVDRADDVGIGGGGGSFGGGSYVGYSSGV